MTEQEWMTSSDPGAMLEWLTSEGIKRVPPQTTRDGRLASDRKLRLFACACCRQVWHLLTDERSRKAVEVAERFADGEAAWEELGKGFSRAPADNSDSMNYTLLDLAWMSCYEGPHRMIDFFREPHQSEKDADFANLLRDIVGNPWRLVELPRPKCPYCDGAGKAWYNGGPYDSGWDPCHDCGGTGKLGKCPWLTFAVVSLARAAYEERLPERPCPLEFCKGGYWRHSGDPNTRRHRCETCHGTGCIDDGTLDPIRLAILADALEEAGCTEEMILRHLRGDLRWPDGSRMIGVVPAPHVRGCWAVDLCLGKE